MTGERRPAAFPVAPADDGKDAPKRDSARAAPRERTGSAAEPPPRAPRAAPLDQLASAVPATVDVFEEPAAAPQDPPPASPPRRRGRLGTVFLAAFGLFVSLALGLWVEGLVRDLFARADWLGWLGAGLAAVAALALALMLAREAMALARLASVERLRTRAAAALAADDAAAARALAHDLAGFVAGKPETARGRRTLAELEGEVIDGADLVRLAETELLAPLDRRARKLVLDAAKRVSVVTAVSPRALVDVAYVLFESGRLIRRLAELYGGRPGTLGFFRLARGVLAHLAVTGSIAAGDSLVHQLVGHGLAARLSARLGEGVVNGMMTARIGIAAMEVARPLPFAAVRRPGMGDFLNALTAFAGRKQRGAADG
ncbi:TIGR01620 family protein [Aquibium sp. A9E412]|uniref:YcjF family protein n=1 Tax=Aquibium sp. A9E412 TaxID=2976767 RepID=UPI0025B1AC00|nr:TIGR01620 family protein [Aquibium sp. A9E412]MDN2568279.1 TIGR01620 family protein [Aquibium sp. A9E412]